MRRPIDEGIPEGGHAEDAATTASANAAKPPEAGGAELATDQLPPEHQKAIRDPLDPAAEWRIAERLVALWQLARELQTPIKRAVDRRLRSYGRSPADGDDLAQEIYRQLMEKGRGGLRRLYQWRPDGMPLKNFVWRYAQWFVGNKSRNFWREQPAREAPVGETFGDGRGEPAHAGSLEAQLQQRDQLNRLRSYVALHTSVQGLKMFDYFYLKDLSVEEISDKEGMKRNTVHKWRSRLKKVIAEFGAENQ